MSTQVSTPRNPRSRKLAESEIPLDSGRAELPGDAEDIAAEMSTYGCDVEDQDCENWPGDYDWPYDDHLVL